MHGPGDFYCGRSGGFGRQSRHACGGPRREPVRGRRADPYHSRPCRSRAGFVVVQEEGHMPVGIRIHDLRKVYNTPPPMLMGAAGFSFVPTRTRGKSDKKAKKFEVIALNGITLD